MSVNVHAVSTGRALVRLDGRTTPRSASDGDDRPVASFLAQLIASDLRLPAYRRAGRLEPDAASAIYGRDKSGRDAASIDLVV